jgi:hypothetical protein
VLALSFARAAGTPPAVVMPSPTQMLTSQTATHTHPFKEIYMKALLIKDLAVTAELNTEAMAAVRGGYAWKMPASLSGFSGFDLPASITTTTVKLDQANNQMQSNATGNGSAVFGGSISAYNNQQGFNSIR